MNNRWSADMTPLFKKLNLSTQAVIHVLNAPESFEDELALLDDVDVRKTVPAREVTSFAMAFVLTQSECDQWSRRLAKAADGDAVIWMAYPKGTSKKYDCDFNRDTGWSVLGTAGFEPVRQVAIDEDWSALRFRRVEYIKSLTRNKSMAISEAGQRRAKPKGTTAEGHE